MSDNDDMSWSQEHKTAADEDFDRLAQQRIERLRQRLDRYNQAIADATASAGKERGASGSKSPMDGPSRPLPAGGPTSAHIDPLRPPGVGHPGLRSTPGAAGPTPSTGDDDVPAASMASTEFDIEPQQPRSGRTTASGGYSSAARQSAPGSAVRTRTTIELQPVFEEVDASSVDGRRSFGIVGDDAHLRTSSTEASARRQRGSRGSESPEVPLSTVRQGTSSSKERSASRSDAGAATGDDGSQAFVVHELREEAELMDADDRLLHPHHDNEDDDRHAASSTSSGFTDDDLPTTDETGNADTDADYDDAVGSDVDDAAAGRAVVSEDEFHAWTRAARAADDYQQLQSMVGKHLFHDIEQWSTAMREAKERRLAALRQETLLSSRHEETVMQSDEVLVRSAQLGQQLQELIDARVLIDGSKYADWEARIEAKKAVADEKLADLQRDIVMVDRRRAHIHALESHNEAKQRGIAQQEAHVAKLKRENEAQKGQLDKVVAAVEASEKKVDQWTEILNRRESAIQRREAQVAAAQRASDADGHPPPRFQAAAGAPASDFGETAASTRFRKPGDRLLSPTAVPPAGSGRVPLQAKEEINVHEEIDCDS